MMRSPNAKMVSDWGKFKALAMNFVDAQIKVEQWSSRIGAKVVLQQAWFRVKDIPRDLRSIRTIAKVGGLVGKVVEIDEKTRYRADYAETSLKFPRLLKGPWGCASMTSSLRGRYKKMTL